MIAVACGDALQRPGRRARSIEQSRPCGRVGLAERGLEQLAGDPERELALELAAARRQPPNILRRTGGGQHGGLADTRRSGDQHDRAVPGLGGVNRRGDRRKLGLALEQRHGAMLPQLRPAVLVAEGTFTDTTGRVGAQRIRGTPASCPSRSRGVRSPIPALARQVSPADGRTRGA